MPLSEMSRTAFSILLWMARKPAADMSLRTTGLPSLRTIRPSASVSKTPAKRLWISCVCRARTLSKGWPGATSPTSTSALCLTPSGTFIAETVQVCSAPGTWTRLPVLASTLGTILPDFLSCTIT